MNTWDISTRAAGTIGWAHAVFTDIQSLYTGLLATVIVTTGTSLTVTAGTVAILNLGTPAAFTFLLPASPSANQMVVITDGAGNASQYRILIDGNGKNINGQASAILSSNYGTITLIFNGTQWNII